MKQLLRWLALSFLWLAQAAQASPIPINQGVGGSWFNAATSGQGFLIDLLPANNFMFVAWFTYEKQTLPGAKVGAVDQRWMTASGTYSGNGATLTLYSTTGGLFNNPQTVASTAVGTMSLSFQDCTHGTISYAIPGESLSGTIPISRTGAGMAAVCESLIPRALNCGGIGGAIRSQAVTIPQRGGGVALQATMFAPNAAAQTAPCPLIALLPGGGGSPISTIEWAAQRLAANGYVVVAVKPQLANSVTSYDNAARSGIDYALSAANPYLASTHASLIGVAGWSLGAFALSITQEQDTRVDAYIGWDNLVTSETGDAGTANCTGAATIVRTPRVPAMGQASDTCNDGRSADAKKTAYEHWKAAAQPTMQVVLKNATHFWWSDTGSNAQHDLSHYYTQNWFDRWLKQDTSATARLTARTINAQPVADVLSATFRSAAFVDGRNCADLVSACAPPVSSSALPSRDSAPPGVR